MRNTIRFFLNTLLFGTMLTNACLYGQAAKQPAAKPKVDTATRNVKFMVKFGPFSSSTPVLTIDFKKLLNAELKVTDSATGTAYQLVSFRLGWRRKEASDDVKTGKRKMLTTFNAVDVYGKSRIPASWQTELSEGAQATEEILFEAIIVQHPQTKKMLQVPSLTFKLR